MKDLLLPSSDTAVAVQFLVLVGIVAAGVLATRRTPSLRVFIIGVGVFVGL